MFGAVAGRGIVPLFLLIVSSIGGVCLEAKQDQAPRQAVAKSPSEIQQFCANITPSAGDAKVAWQAARLIELEGQLRKRIVELDSKKAELIEWMQKRDAAMKKAEESIVAIYSRMRPDAAASQLAAMDEELAAALLAKLNSRSAGAILNEMDPRRAAKLTNTMSGPPQDGKKS